MKKIILILLVITISTITGCQIGKKNIYLPEANNDKSFSIVSGNENTHQGEGYILTLPDKKYRYEKDYDDGNLEEKWDYIKKDDVEIKVTTYKNSDEITARSKFLRENDDYIFEDLMGYSICGTELDGDTLWFRMHQSGTTVYIISWEYPKNTKDSLKKELSGIADTFKLT